MAPKPCPRPEPLPPRPDHGPASSSWTSLPFSEKSSQHTSTAASSDLPRQVSTATLASVIPINGLDHSLGIGSNKYSASEARSLDSRYEDPLDAVDDEQNTLPCEFMAYNKCDYRYPLARTGQWMTHIVVDHLNYWLPTRCACWFCGDHVFDTVESGLDVTTNFCKRLLHIRNHIIHGFRVDQITPDINFVAHIRGLGLITQEAYLVALGHGEGSKLKFRGRGAYDYVALERQRQLEEREKLFTNKSNKKKRSWQLQQDITALRVDILTNKFFDLVAHDIYLPVEGEDERSFIQNVTSERVKPHLSPESDFLSAKENVGKLGKGNMPHDAEAVMHEEEVLPEGSEQDLKDFGDTKIPRVHEESIIDGIPLDGANRGSESSDLTTSSSSSDLTERGALHSASHTRQVGLVTVQIDQLSLFDHCLASKNEDESPEYRENFADNEQGDGITEIECNVTGSQVADESSPASPGESEPTSQRTNKNSRQPDGEESDGDQNERRRTPNRKRKNPVCSDHLLRFACPYQAFDVFQNCFKPGPRNARGGCTGINRLKQHLGRRHMQSFRCQRCWGAFDSRRKVREHEGQPTQCNSREMPQHERFMNVEQEAEIETACRSVSEEEAWWNLFRLLIPGMQGRDIKSLSPPYQPHYIDRQSSFVIPSVTLSNISFEPTSQSASSEGESLRNTSEYSDLLGTDDFNFEIPRTPFVIQPAASQIITMPLMQVLDKAPADNDYSAFLSPPEMSASTQLNLNFDSSSSSNSFPPSRMSAPASEASGILESSLNNQVQLRRNHERLREKNRQSEANIAELRRAMEGTLKELNDADTLVEDLLSSGDLSHTLYDTLDKISSILRLAKEKLR